MAKLVIFDIDGTLVNSSKVDEECFVRAAEDAFAIRNIDTRWEMYRHATDGAIFEEVFETAFGRKPTEAEVKKQTERFLHHLKECRKEAPELFREVSGASQLLRYLTKHPQWKPAIATGTWKKAALLKLEGAGLDVRGIPLATSSDAHSREEIIRGCIAAAIEQYRTPQFERFVSVGDAVWDARAAASLGIPFIRINPAGKADGSGLPHVLEDFSDRDRFFTYLEEALVPA